MNEDNHNLVLETPVMHTQAGAEKLDAVYRRKSRTSTEAALLFGAMTAFCGVGVTSKLFSATQKRSKVPDPARQEAARLKQLRKAERRQQMNTRSANTIGVTRT